MPASYIPKRVRADAAISASPAAAATGRRRPPSRIPIPPATASLSLQASSVPGLPSCSGSAATGAIRRFITVVATRSPMTPSTASLRAGAVLARASRGGGAPRPFRLHAYVVLLLTTGMRPEEARALRWDHLDLDAGTVSIWRSDRAGGDTKTSRSRRTLKLPAIAVAALRQRGEAQAAEKLRAGEAWVDTGLVFTTALGTKLDQDNIRRDFRRITKEAGLGEDWVPRELRHTFVSILSAGGVPVEEIAITAGAEVMDSVFVT
jgi:integrase